MGDFQEPAGRLVEFLEGEFEGAVVHGNKLAGAEVFEGLHGLVGAHVDFSKRVGVIGADGQQRNFRRHSAADFFEPMKVGTVTRVVDAAALMFQYEAAVAAVPVAQRAGAPVFAGSECDFPVVVGKCFPPFEFNNALEAQVEREIADTPGHDADFRVRQAAQCGFVEMIKMGVSQENEVNGRKVLQFEAGAFDAFQKKKPVGEIRVDENIQIRELKQERSVADPGDGDLACSEFGESRFSMLAGAPCEQGFPDHLVKERPGIEVFGRS